MKTCSYCGAEYPDDAIMCTIDHTPFEQLVTEPQTDEPKQPEYRFPELSTEDRQRDFVTLATCATLPSADVIVGRLEAAGIEAFVPDESVMNVLGSTLSAFGFVRVQISPKDYDAAKELLSDIYAVG